MAIQQHLRYHISVVQFADPINLTPTEYRHVFLIPPDTRSRWLSQQGLFYLGDINNSYLDEMKRCDNSEHTHVMTSFTCGRNYIQYAYVPDVENAE